MKTRVKSRFHVQAHRGASCEFQENTIPAFRKAIELGAHSIELDVHISKDGVPVIFHDFLVSPKSCQGIRSEVPIHSLTWDEIAQLEVHNPKRLKSFHHIDGEEAKIPKLSDVFRMFFSEEITLDIEIKSDPQHPDWSVSPQRFSELLLSEVHQYWKDKNYAFRSFDYRVLEEIRRQDSKIPIIALTTENTQDYNVIAETIRPQILAPWKDSISKEQVTSLKIKGIEVMPYTVNRKEEWLKFFKWGIYGVTTDDPRGLIAFLETKELNSL